MANQYFDSELTGVQIEQALKAISGLISPSNNGKILYVDNGKLGAKSATEFEGVVLEPLSVTANGDYTPPSGTDGFDEVHVAVPSATLTTKSITANGVYNASSDNADGYSSVVVNVQDGGSAVVQSLSVTQNGTYNPPSGVDGYAPVTVNVKGKHIVSGADTVISTNSGERTPVLKKSRGASACIICYNAGGSGSGGNWSIVFSVAETEEDAIIYYPSTAGAASSFTYNGHTYYFSTVASNTRWGGATDMTNPLGLPTITGIQMMDVANNTLTDYGRSILSLLMEV